MKLSQLKTHTAEQYTVTDISNETFSATSLMMKPITLNQGSRIIIMISSLIMIAGYFLPLWSIDLEAPQYPEGLSMQIWVNDITGDVDKINGLNHYIGMKHIIKDEFVEFKVMPYMLASMILFGLLAAIMNKRWFLWTYVIFMICILIVGLYDFWSWEYDYGHNLDPKAAINIPGMNYQPPLIGYKQLLNFLAASFPTWGGYFIFAGGIAIAVVLGYEQFLRKK